MIVNEENYMEAVADEDSPILRHTLELFHFDTEWIREKIMGAIKEDIQPFIDDPKNIWHDIDRQYIDAWTAFDPDGAGFFDVRMFEGRIYVYGLMYAGDSHYLTTNMDDELIIFNGKKWLVW